MTSVTGAGLVTMSAGNPFRRAQGSRLQEEITQENGFDTQRKPSYITMSAVVEDRMRLTIYSFSSGDAAANKEEEASGNTDTAAFARRAQHSTAIVRRKDRVASATCDEGRRWR